MEKESYILKKNVLKVLNILDLILFSLLYIISDSESIIIILIVFILFISIFGITYKSNIYYNYIDKTKLF